MSLQPELTLPDVYLLIVEFLGLSRLEELQQISQCAFIVMPERIAWAVPVTAQQQSDKLICLQQLSAVKQHKSQPLAHP